MTPSNPSIPPLQTEDIENLVQFVNLVLEKATFNDFTALQAIKFSEQIVKIKDLKHKLDHIIQTSQGETPNGLPIS